jgi:hypothetical protein
MHTHLYLTTTRGLADDRRAARHGADATDPGDDKMKRFILAAAAGGGLAATAQAADDAQLRAAIAGSHRTAANVARDQYRHPYETLTSSASSRP